MTRHAAADEVTAKTAAYYQEELAEEARRIYQANRSQHGEDEEDEGTPVRCDRCDAVEYVGGEIAEETLEGAGWYLGFNSALCPDHNDEEEV